MGPDTKDQSTATTATPTPIHSVVAVVGDILTPLSHDERTRAMKAVALSLNMRTPFVIEGDAGNAGDTSLKLVAEIAQSLRPDQISAISNILDMPQKIMTLELAKLAQSLNGG